MSFHIYIYVYICIHLFNSHICTDGALVNENQDLQLKSRLQTRIPSDEDATSENVDWSQLHEGRDYGEHRAARAVSFCGIVQQ